MNMLRFGYYYHLPELYSRHRALIMGYNEDKFQFYKTDYTNIPREYFKRTCCYHRLHDPVVFTMNDGELKDIIFLKDIPIYERNDKNNYTGTYILTDTKSGSAELFFHNAKYESEGHSEKELSFIKLLLESVVINSYIDKLAKISQEIRPLDYKWKEGKSNFYRLIKRYKEYINSVDLPALLSSLYVEVTDHLKTKIGDDDTYYIYRYATLKDGTAVDDDYLKEVMGLGNKCIYEDGGYSNKLEYYAKDFLEEHPLGIYDGETLEHEKERILKSYSKEEHMAWLFYKQLYRQYESEISLKEWHDRAIKNKEQLNKEFNYDKLSSLDERVFYDPKKVEELNNYLLQVQC